jgi:hypothetical protein
MTIPALRMRANERQGSFTGPKTQRVSLIGFGPERQTPDPFVIFCPFKEGQPLTGTFRAVVRVPLAPPPQNKGLQPFGRRPATLAHSGVQRRAGAGQAAPAAPLAGGIQVEDPQGFLFILPHVDDDAQATPTVRIDHVAGAGKA